jgi:hypothetical protein
MPRALAFLCLIALAACTAELPESDALFRPSDDSGSIQIRLLGSDASGRQYRLRHATFELSGSAMVTLSTTRQDAVQNSLYTPLPSGTYQLFLRPGYEVVELAHDGEERTVAARLDLEGPLQIDVLARRDQQVALRFLRDEQEITFGASGPRAVVGHAAAHHVLARVP